jgi:HEPN domain-containing protein
MNDKERWVMEWFEKGDRDLRAAEAMLHLEDPLPDIACFHAQQCVEKYLKGFLSFHDIEVRRTHDLVELLTECGNIDPSFIEWEEVCRSLTIYAIAPRYPDSSREYLAEEGEDAVSLATRLKEFVRSKIRLGD